MTYSLPRNYEEQHATIIGSGSKSALLSMCARAAADMDDAIAPQIAHDQIYIARGRTSPEEMILGDRGAPQLSKRDTRGWRYCNPYPSPIFIL